jgi:hypothetical protein
MNQGEIDKAEFIKSITEVIQKYLDMQYSRNEMADILIMIISRLGSD